MQTTGGKNSRKFTKCWLIWDVLRRVNYFSLSLGTLIFLKSGSIVLAQSALNQGTAVEIKRGQQRNISQMESDRTVAEKAFAEGEQLRDRGNKDSLQQAIAKYQVSLRYWQILADLSWQGTTLVRIGTAYDVLGEHQQAINFFNQGLLIWEKIDDSFRKADTFIRLGIAHESQKEYQKAIGYYEQGLPLLRNIHNYSEEISTLNRIANLYKNLNNYKYSLIIYNQALSLSRNVRDLEKEAYTLSNIGLIYKNLGEMQKAIDAYNQAISKLETIKNLSLEEVNLLHNIGNIYAIIGEYQKALNIYDKILPSFRAVNNYLAEGRTLNNIANVYYTLGEFQKALDYYHQALVVHRRAIDTEGEAFTLNYIGAIYSILSEIDKSLDYYNQSLLLHKKLGNIYGEAIVYNYIGNAYVHLGKYQVALKYHNKALSLRNSIGDLYGKARTLDEIGTIYRFTNKPEIAIQYYSQSLSINQKMDYPYDEALTLKNIATIEASQNNLDKALTHIQAAIAIIESLRTNINSSDLRASYFATVQSYYILYIDILMQLHQQNPKAGYNIAALEVSERARARSLLELLNESRTDIRQGIEPKLRDKERELQQKIAAKTQYQLQLLKRQPTTEQTENIRKEISKLQTQLEQIEGEIRAKNPRYAALTQPQPLTVKEIQQQVVDADSILLAYWLGEERSYLWAVTPTTINTYILPKRAEIQAAAKEFLDFLTVPSMRGTIKAKAATANLSQILLGQVASELGQKRLVIVGDGALQSIPFSALFVPNSNSTETAKPLFVDHEIVNLPSASTVALIRRDTKQRQPAPKAIAVIADPVFSSNDNRLKNQSATATHTPSLQQERLTRDLNRKPGEALFARLPGTRQEAEKILNLVQKSDRFQAFDFEASRQTATTSQLSQYRIVHFATHGFLNNQHPELSGIALSLVDKQAKPQDGLLLTPDIFNLNLPAELVVLSGCETGLGKEIRGEGIVGLTRGLMYAGASRVLVSLWSVQDTSTAELMTKFYQGMLEKGLTPAAALRAAQLQMWQQEDTQEPYYWASFILQGEWR